MLKPAAKLVDPLRVKSTEELKRNLRNYRAMLFGAFAAFMLPGLFVLYREQTLIAFLMFIFGNIPTIIAFVLHRKEAPRIIGEIERRERHNRYAKRTEPLASLTRRDDL